MKVSIVGAYNTKFGAFVSRKDGVIEDTQSIYAMLLEAGAGAIADAGIDAEEIDAIWIGSCSPAQFVNQEHLGPFGIEVDPGHLLHKPTTRVEAACASSSIALYNAAYAVESGRFKNVLVIGVEKMNLLDSAAVSDVLAKCSYWPDEGAKGLTFPGLFAKMAESYKTHFKLYDSELEYMLAAVSAQNYSYGIKNPLAHFGPNSVAERKNLTTAEAIISETQQGRNPMIATPLRLHDCSLISDGAAALVLTSTDNAKKQFSKAVELSGVGHVTERIMLDKRSTDIHDLSAVTHAYSLAEKEAGISLNNISLIEVHDCFTINQILCVEALGLSKSGQGGHDHAAGKFALGGQYPVNLSGGLKAKGHPVGATGASMHALMYKQIVGEPIGQSVNKAVDHGVVVNVGGSAVTNCVSVMRRVK